MLEQRVNELKQIIAGNDGRNAADARFARAVDELVSEVYDDIGEAHDLPARALFDLFVIKVLYVGRHSCHAGVVDYLGSLLESQLDAGRLFPSDEQGRPRRLYFSDMLRGEPLPAGCDSVFEAYRQYADGALFLAGVFPSSLLPRRRATDAPLRRGGTPAVDRGYYVSTGKAMYRMASDRREAEQPQRDTLAKLAEHFEVYVDALNEMSARYIMGCDTELIGDKMLDAFNRHRETGDAGDLANARRYAAMLRLEPALFAPSDRRV